jgi:peptide-methionine (S)-S-oxide reductase
MRQRNDVGTQYRSGIYAASPGRRSVRRGRRAMPIRKSCTRPATGAISTEIVDAPQFYYTEDYHRQYLAKNPNDYCGLGGTGIRCPVGVAPAA